ncbi:MAG TPA: OB-fold domain-containing protein [Thermoplasmata archaeon]|nr:OB-fold domain-containing protein [Thermoplasmata archaeon]
MNGGSSTHAQPPEPSAAHTIHEFEHGYEEEQRLRGFRSACGFVTATWGLHCPRCGKLDLVEFPLSGKGVVAAFTVQNVPADEFVNDAPYAYVLVDLDEGGRISGWMPSIRSVTDLAIGERVHWVQSYKPGVQFEKDVPLPGAARR